MRNRVNSYFVHKISALLLVLILVVSFTSSAFAEYVPASNTAWEAVYHKQSLVSAAYGNGVYVAADGSGIVKVSFDAQEWNNVQLPDGKSMSSIVFGKSKFIGTSQGSLLTSEDGQHWKSIELSEGDQLNVIIFNGEQFIAVGKGGYICMSTDGIVWQVHKSPLLEDKEIIKIVAANGKFVCTNSIYADQLYVSSDGIDWNEVIPLEGYRNYENLASNDSVFYVSSSSYESTSGASVAASFVSEDGVNWSKKEEYLPGFSDLTSDVNRFISE